jgi:hypothetical protein
LFSFVPEIVLTKQGALRGIGGIALGDAAGDDDGGCGNSLS